MTRKNIFEILSSKYDVYEEIRKIKKIFNSKIFVYTNPFNYQKQIYSLEELVDDRVFFHWKQRNSCVDCKEMKKKIVINEIFNDMFDIVKHLEYYINIIELAKRELSITQNIHFEYHHNFIILCKNIDLLLEHISYEKLLNQKEEEVILISKNPAAIAVAEITKNKDIAFAILKYNHASLKGDLEGKKQLLASIATEYEPLLSKHIDGFSDYFDKATNMLNNLNIRHNNKEGKHKKDLLTNMSDTELEKWYDELYQLLLFCVLIQDNVKRKKNIEEFLAQVNAKK